MQTRPLRPLPRLAGACLLLLAGQAMATPRFTPATYDFGNVFVGQSATVTVFLDETGADTLRSLGVGPTTASWYDSDSGDFHLQRGTCVQGVTPLSGGAGCTFSITYTPTAPGTATTNAIASNNNAGSWGFMALSGTGVARPQAVPALGGGAVAALSALVALMALGSAAMARRRRGG